MPLTFLLIDLTGVYLKQRTHENNKTFLCMKTRKIRTVRITWKHQDEKIRMRFNGK